jgi:hypothetical protein
LSFRFGDTEIDNKEGDEENDEEYEEDGPEGCTKKAAATLAELWNNDTKGGKNTQHKHRGRIIVGFNYDNKEDER